MDLSRTLNLIDVSAPASESVGGCGSDGCGCGHGGSATTQTVATASSATVVGVSDRACAHRLSSVREERGALPGVDGVSVELRPDGVSLVSIDAAEAPDLETIRAAVSVAGYQLAD